jgi:hypothetical protein
LNDFNTIFNISYVIDRGKKLEADALKEFIGGSNSGSNHDLHKKANALHGYAGAYRHDEMSHNNFFHGAIDIHQASGRKKSFKLQAFIDPNSVTLATSVKVFFSFLFALI